MLKLKQKFICIADRYFYEKGDTLQIAALEDDGVCYVWRYRANYKTSSYHRFHEAALDPKYFIPKPFATKVVNVRYKERTFRYRLRLHPHNPIVGYPLT